MSRQEVFSGEVIHGVGRGKTLGIPTANLQVEQGELLPRGVHAARVSWAEVSPRIAVANVGTRPTFKEGEVSIEVHILDFDGDLYGISLNVELVEFLRAERAFAAVEDLQEQIRVDIKKTRDIFA